MMKIKTILVDDEPLARERIRTLLADEPDVEIVAECANGLEAVATLANCQPDLLFLDVQMPELDGFAVLQNITPERIPVIIFVTAYDHYALRAFEVHALDYLLKPFDDEGGIFMLKHFHRYDDLLPQFVPAKKLLPWLLWLAFANTMLHAQSFTKITDPNNPVVNDQFESGGGSWADCNRDGYPDLFVANGNLNSQNNSLYLNDRHGSFIKIVTGAMVNDGGSSIGGTWGDFNRDRALDLLVTNRNAFGNFLYQGGGDSAFVKITTGSAVTDRGNSNSSSWVDVDNDGDLDLFVINFEADDFFI